MTSKLIPFPMALLEKQAGCATAAHRASNKQRSSRNNAPARIAAKLARLEQIHVEAVSDVEGLLDNLLAAFDPDYRRSGA